MEFNNEQHYLIYQNREYSQYKYNLEDYIRPWFSYALCYEIKNILNIETLSDKEKMDQINLLIIES